MRRSLVQRAKTTALSSGETITPLLGQGTTTPKEDLNLNSNRGAGEERRRQEMRDDAITENNSPTVKPPKRHCSSPPTGVDGRVLDAFIAKPEHVLVCKLKGRDHHQLGVITNTPLTVMPEPGNEMDSNAMIVMDGKGFPLGYVNKSTARILSPLIKAGFIDVIVKSVVSDTDELVLSCVFSREQHVQEDLRMAFGFDTPLAPRMVTTTIPDRMSSSSGFHSASTLLGIKRTPDKAIIEAARNFKIAVAGGGSSRGAATMTHTRQSVKLQPRHKQQTSILQYMEVTTTASKTTATTTTTSHPCQVQQQCNDVNFPPTLDMIYTFLSMNFDQREQKLQQQNRQWHEIARLALEHLQQQQRHHLPTITSLFHEIQQSYLTYSTNNHKSEKFTPEQLDVINLELRHGDLIQVSAYAGAGKTSTLVRLTLCHPTIRFLYLCFNKSVQSSGEKKFPKSNVATRTLHSFALEHTKDEHGRPVWWESDDEAFLSAKRFWGDDEDVDTAKSLRELTSFLNSSKLSPLDGEGDAKTKSRVNELWCAMIAKRIPFTLQGVLKLFTLTKPDLFKLGYHVVLLDEAQDSSACVLDMFLSQHQCTKIMVGDGHQSIYSFLQAKNALARAATGTNDCKCLKLSRSFRFSAGIANLATRLLNLCKKLDTELVVGAGPRRDCVIGRAHPTETLVEFVRRVQHMIRGTKASICYVSRTNASSIETAMKLMDTSPSLKFGFVGGLSASRINDLIDLAALGCGKFNNIKSHFVASFTSIDALTGTCRARGMREWTSALGLIRRNWGNDYGTTYVDLQKLKNHVVDCDKAELLFSTVHRCKGSEFDGVWLSDDFPIVRHPTFWKRVCGKQMPRMSNDIMDDNNNIDMEEEINLLYVACTRARVILVLSESIEKCREAMDALLGCVPRWTDVAQQPCVKCKATSLAVVKGTSYVGNSNHALLDNGEKCDAICVKCMLEDNAHMVQ